MKKYIITLNDGTVIENLTSEEANEIINDPNVVVVNLKESKLSPAEEAELMNANIRAEQAKYPLEEVSNAENLLPYLLPSSEAILAEDIKTRNPRPLKYTYNVVKDVVTLPARAAIASVRKLITDPKGDDFSQYAEDLKTTEGGFLRNVANDPITYVPGVGEVKLVKTVASKVGPKLGKYLVKPAIEATVQTGASTADKAIQEKPITLSDVLAEGGIGTGAGSLFTGAGTVIKKYGVDKIHEALAKGQTISPTSVQKLIDQEGSEVLPSILSTNPFDKLGQELQQRISKLDPEYNEIKIALSKNPSSDINIYKVIRDIKRKADADLGLSRISKDSHKEIMDLIEKSEDDIITAKNMRKKVDWMSRKTKDPLVNVLNDRYSSPTRIEGRTNVLDPISGQYRPKKIDYDVTRSDKVLNSEIPLEEYLVDDYGNVIPTITAYGKGKNEIPLGQALNLRSQLGEVARFDKAKNKFASKSTTEEAFNRDYYGRINEEISAQVIKSNVYDKLSSKYKKITSTTPPPDIEKIVNVVVNESNLNISDEVKNDIITSVMKNYKTVINEGLHTSMGNLPEKTKLKTLQEKYGTIIPLKQAAEYAVNRGTNRLNTGLVGLRGGSAAYKVGEVTPFLRKYAIPVTREAESDSTEY